MYSREEDTDLGRKEIFAQQRQPLTQPDAVRVHQTLRCPNPDQSRTNMQYNPTADRLASPPEGAFASPPPKKLTRQQKRRRCMMWVIPLAILVIVLSVLFEVYKSDFENWVQPLKNWLDERQTWSWTLPILILIVLNFPPLFGQEIIQLIVGLAYPVGIAIGIACAGSVLGELACFIVSKFLFTVFVRRKIAEKVSWAATARVAQEAGFRGVLVIRYSLVPPHLANPLFACTGMRLYIYMGTVFLSLPKQIILVVLGSPSSEHSKAAKYAKIIAIVFLVLITVFASRWIRPRMSQAANEIEMERSVVYGERSDNI